MDEWLAFRSAWKLSKPIYQGSKTLTRICCKCGRLLPQITQISLIQFLNLTTFWLPDSKSQSVEPAFQLSVNAHRRQLTISEICVICGKAFTLAQTSRKALAERRA